MVMKTLLSGEMMHKLDQLDPNTLMQLACLAQEEIRRRGLDDPVAGPKRAPKAARIFQVPETVKYLDPGQLDALTRSFRDWLHAARDARTRQARTRIWLLFLMLRYTRSLTSTMAPTSTSPGAWSWSGATRPARYPCLPRSWTRWPSFSSIP